MRNRTIRTRFVARPLATAAVAVTTAAGLVLGGPASAAPPIERWTPPVRIIASPAGAGSACTTLAPCSLEAAIARVTQARADMSSDLVVYLRGGRYPVSSTIELSGAQSGANGHRVIVRNFPGESPVLSGGQRITGWTRGSDGLWSADAHGLNFFQLYGDGLMFTRARTEVAVGWRWTVAGSRAMKVEIPASMVPAGGIADLTGVQVRFMHTWRELRYPVVGIGPDTDGARLLDLATPISTWSDTATGLNPVATVTARDRRKNGTDQPGGETFLEGAKEFMDSDNEWYLDTHADRVYLKSPVDPDSLDVIAPVTERLLHISGASHLTFYGVQFAHTSWNRPLLHGNFQRQGGIHMRDVPQPGNPTTQGLGKWYVNPAAVVIGDSRDVRFERNGFRDTGANAVNLDKGTTDIAFVANIFSRLSDSGLWVGTDQEGLPEDPADMNVNTTVKNNVFRGLGRTYGTDSAVTMTYPHGATIAHNDIRDINNLGVNIGWFNLKGGPTQKSALQDVHVTANRIDHTCVIARDCGGWHSLRLYAYGDDGNGGAIPRSTVSRNYVTNVHVNPISTATGSLARALYADATANGLVITDNTWDDVDEGLHINPNAGDDLTVHGNGPGKFWVKLQAGLQLRYRYLLHIDLDTDSVGGYGSPHHNG